MVVVAKVRAWLGARLSYEGDLPTGALSPNNTMKSVARSRSMSIAMSVSMSQANCFLSSEKE